jgi:hypothetical protein
MCTDGRTANRFITEIAYLSLSGVDKARALCIKHGHRLQHPFCTYVPNRQNFIMALLSSFQSYIVSLFVYNHPYFTYQGLL